MIWRMKNGLTGRRISPQTQQLVGGQEIWLLGVRYGNISYHETYVRFIDHFKSVMFFVYRRDFPALRMQFLKIGFKVTSDCGWGCMMRSGQMMLSNAFLFLRLGRNWRRPKTFVYEEPESNLMVVNEGKFPVEITEITNLFFDTPSNPFSIHSIVSEGTNFGKSVGAWFGPTTICNVFNNLISRKDFKPELRCYLSSDTVVYIDELKKLCSEEIEVPIFLNSTPLDDVERKDEKSSQPRSSSNENNDHSNIRSENKSSSSSSNNNNGNSVEVEEEEEEEEVEGEELGEDLKNNNAKEENESEKSREQKFEKRFREPLVILIPLRLGLEEINEVYLPYFQKVFQHPQTLGIIGGRKPMHSLYFIGYQEENFLFLDPHTCQKMSMEPETYFCGEVRKISFSKIDPSLALGFLCNNMEEVDQFLKFSEKLLTGGAFPIFSIQKKIPRYVRRMKEENNNIRGKNKKGKKKKRKR